MSEYTAGTMTPEEVLSAIRKRPELYMPLVLEHVSRVTLVTARGRAFERFDMYENGVELHLQDGGRTLKVFPKRGD